MHSKACQLHLLYTRVRGIGDVVMLLTGSGDFQAVKQCRPTIIVCISEGGHVRNEGSDISLLKQNHLLFEWREGKAQDGNHRANGGQIPLDGSQQQSRSPKTAAGLIECLQVSKLARLVPEVKPFGLPDRRADSVHQGHGVCSCQDRNTCV